MRWTCEKNGASLTYRKNQRQRYDGKREVCDGLLSRKLLRTTGTAINTRLVIILAYSKCCLYIKIQDL